MLVCFWVYSVRLEAYRKLLRSGRVYWAKFGDVIKAEFGAHLQGVLIRCVLQD